MTNTGFYGPSYDTEVEYTVIGEIIKRPEIMAEAVGIINRDSFSAPELARIYDRCAELFASDDVIDPITVVSAFGAEKDDYKEVILQCAAGIASPAGYRRHMEIVAEQAIKRRVVGICNDISLGVYTETSELQKALTDALRLFNDRASNRIKDVLTLNTEFYNWMVSDDDCIKTGLPVLDRHLKISAGDYIIIAGRPSSGKTALALQTATHMAKKHNVVFFSFETSALKLWQRVVAASSNTDFGDIKNRMFDSINWEGISNFALWSADKLHMHIVEASGMTVAQMRATAVQLKAEVIYIDYLTLIKDDGKTGYERATQISMDLHRLAQKDKLAIVALSQLSRNGSGAEASMSDLRDSGQIEQDADAILIIPPNEDEGENVRRRPSLCKNKDGYTGDIELWWRGRYQQFSGEEADETQA